MYSIFPVLKSELRFSEVQLGLLGSLFLWTYGLASPFAGQIADRYSKRNMILLSLVLWSGVTTATGLANSKIMILACRALMGLTEALFVPAAVALIASLYGPETLSLPVGLFFSAQLSGLALGGWYGGYIAQEFRWRWGFYSLGGLGILYAFPLWLLLRRVNEVSYTWKERAVRRLAIAELVKVPTYVCLCACFPAYTALLWMLYTWLPDFLYEKFSLSLASAGFTAVVYLQCASLVGLVIGGALADRLYRRTKPARFWVLCAGLLSSAPWACVLGHSHTLAYAKLAIAGFGLGAGFFIANLSVCPFDVVPVHTRASSVAFFNVIGTPVSGLAALFGGVLRDKIGLQNVMDYASGAAVVMGLLLVIAVKVFFTGDHAKVSSQVSAP